VGVAQVPSKSGNCQPVFGLYIYSSLVLLHYCLLLLTLPFCASVSTSVLPVHLFIYSPPVVPRNSAETCRLDDVDSTVRIHVPTSRRLREQGAASHRLLRLRFRSGILPEQASLLSLTCTSRDPMPSDMISGLRLEPLAFILAKP
jgi:hypothetical protein